MNFESRLMQIKWAFLLVMLAVPIRLAVIQWAWRDTLIFHPFNSRVQERLAYRGRIVDRHGHTLACSQGNRRVYPYGSLVAHWTGFYSNQYGTSGTERWKQELLRERREDDGITSRPGHTLKLSLDLDAQRRLEKLFPHGDGAALLLDLNRGQVVAACSSPSFEPYRVGVEWAQWQRDEHSPLLNRPFLGLYPAGELWDQWKQRWQRLPRRPATVMDWAQPTQVKGEWLISPAHVAAVLLSSGSNLPLSQLYSDHAQTWRADPIPPPLTACPGGWRWSQKARLGSQVVCWAVAVRPPYAVVACWEEDRDPQGALKACWGALPASKSSED